MKSLAPVLMLLACSFFVSITQAQSMCIDLFSKQEDAENIKLLPDDFTNIKVFEFHRRQLLAAESIEQKNSHMYDLVSSVNEVLDGVTMNILTIQSGRLPQEVVDAYAQSSAFLMNTLEAALNIPSEALIKVVQIRLERQMAGFEELKQNEANRIAMGFLNSGRPRETDADPLVEKWTIGFLSRPLSEISTEPVQKNPIGFVLFPIKGNELSNRAPIGFIHWKNSDANTTPQNKGPIGFIDFSKNTDRKQPELNKIKINFENGDFEIVRPGYKLGF